MKEKDKERLLLRTISTMRHFEAQPYLSKSGYTPEQFTASQETTKHWRNMFEDDYARLKMGIDIKP
jgi:hypothetical protein